MKWPILAGIFVAVAAYNGDTQASKDELVVIVNKSNPVQGLGREELRPMFQTIKTQWRDGSRITPYNLPEADQVRRGFDSAVLGLDPDRVARYWIDRKIRGGERAPTKLPTTAAVLRSVAANPSGIGYLTEGESNGTVKIVARIRGDRVLPP